MQAANIHRRPKLSNLKVSFDENVTESSKREDQGRDALGRRHPQKRPLTSDQDSDQEIAHQRVKVAVSKALGKSVDVAREVVEIGAEALEFVLAIELSACTKILANIWNHVQKVETNRLSCLALTEHCANILFNVRAEIEVVGHDVGESLRDPMDKLTESFCRIDYFVSGQVSRPFLKWYLKRAEDARKIISCGTSLADTISLFDRAILLHTLKGVQELSRSNPQTPIVVEKLIQLDSQTPPSSQENDTAISVIRIAETIHNTLQDAADLCAGIQIALLSELVEAKRLVIPSRRDFMATTSEGPVETSTATVRQLDQDRSLLSTPYHQFLTMASPSKATLATRAGSPQNQSTVVESSEETGQHIDSEMSMVSSPPKSPEEEVHGDVVQRFAEHSETRRNTTPTMDEVPNIDIEPDDSVSVAGYREDDALTIDIQTAAASSESAFRPVSFYSADDRTIDLYTPTDDDGDYASTVFHSGSAGTSRAPTPTADFYSAGDVTAPAIYISSPSAESIADRQQLVTSPENSPPTPSTLAAYIQPYSDQRNKEVQKTTESYRSSSSNVVGKQEVQTTVNPSTTTNERQTSRWTQFKLMDAYRATAPNTTRNTTLQGKRSASTDYAQMKR